MERVQQRTARADGFAGLTSGEIAYVHGNAKAKKLLGDRVHSTDQHESAGILRYTDYGNASRTLEAHDRQGTDGHGAAHE